MAPVLLPRHRHNIFSLRLNTLPFCTTLHNPALISATTTTPIFSLTSHTSRCTPRASLPASHYPPTTWAVPANNTALRDNKYSTFELKLDALIKQIEELASNHFKKGTFETAELSSKLPETNTAWAAGFSSRTLLLFILLLTAVVVFLSNITKIITEKSLET